MIARAPYLFLLLILIPDLYFDRHYWRHRLSPGKRFLYWLPSIALVVYTLALTNVKNFIPDNPTLLYIYLLLLGLIAVPKAAFMLCSVTGLATCKLFRTHKNYGNLVGLLCVPVIWYIVFYGSFIGFNKLEVNYQEYSSPDIPKEFDGYKIVLFSDAHVGSYTERNQYVLQRAVNSINAQHPDMIVFTGDLQNTQPPDLYRHMDVLSTLKAKENENRIIERGKSHIIIAGMENDGDGIKFPQKGDVNKTLNGISTVIPHKGGSDAAPFILMLEHDPSAWRRKIIPDGRAQLTLSGHTHKMQFSLFGWCPMTLTGKEVNGWYEEGNQSLFVTAGLGGLIPFRFGSTGEIVVLTLRTQ